MEKSFAFNSVNGDRRYLAEDFREYFSSFIGNGVFPNPSTGLQVYSNNDMTITVKGGKGWINGAIYVNTDDLILNIDPADGVLNRIDRIVLRFDTLNREIKIYVKKGTFASSPIAPTLQRDADIYELALADVNIKAGSIEILQSNINDLRLNSELCGIVVGTVKEIDTTTLYLKIQAYIDERGQEVEEWINEATTAWGNDFNYWFDTVKDTLDGDTAGNLLDKILKLVAKDAELETKIKEVEKDIKEEIKEDIADLKQSVSSGKQLIATAITGRGVPTSGGDSFQTMADNIDSIKVKLPINEGDVGVTEDSEGNVFGVEKIINKHVYDIGVKVSQEWSYVPSENISISRIGVDSDGNIYCGNKQVIKISPEGEELWFYAVGVLTSITVDKDDNIYYSTSEKIGKIDSNKELIWEKNISVSGKMVIDDNYLYSYRSYYVSKHTLDGDTIWTKSSRYLISSLGVDSEGNVFYGTSNKELYKLSPDGNETWTLNDHTSNVYSLAVGSDGYVYTGSLGEIRKITPDGKEVWKIKKDTFVIMDIGIDNADNIYSSTNGRTAYKHSPDNEEYWRFEFTNINPLCVAVDNNGYVYLGCSDKSVKKIKDNYKIAKIALLKEREVIK